MTGPHLRYDASRRPEPEALPSTSPTSAFRRRRRSSRQHVRFQRQWSLWNNHSQRRLRLLQAFVVLFGVVLCLTAWNVVLPRHSSTLTPPTDAAAVASLERLQSLEQGYSENAHTLSRVCRDNFEWLYQMVQELDFQIINNIPIGMRWAIPEQLPPLPGDDRDRHKQWALWKLQDTMSSFKKMDPLSPFFYRARGGQDRTPLAWEAEWDAMQKSGNIPGLAVDYRDPDKYTYPNVLLEPSAQGYPKLTPLRDIFTKWPQDEDYTGQITETLIHFNYSDPIEREASIRFRDLELPFKLYDIPEIVAASEKWTDEYLHQQFDVLKPQKGLKILGKVQESPDNFFCFFNEWNVQTFGLPPVRDNDMPYEYWAEHAKYADAVRLPFDRPHFYFAGDFKQTRLQNDDSFFNRDLPSFGSLNDTYFCFNVTGQWGIQCRMGERGVVAAQHQDPGRNMVAMIHGAKRYLLAPPKECGKLGIYPQHTSSMWRHSILNYGHIRYLDDPTHTAGMSEKERRWLERAATSGNVETVLKQGEVLYIPSHWFHFIISTQKSTQCNVRSGVVEMGTPEFGGKIDVDTCGQSFGV